MGKILLPNAEIDNVKMIIFDKDGTLIDIHHYWCSMIQFRAEFLVNSIRGIDKEILYQDLISSMGIDLKTKKMKSEGPVGIKPRAFIIDIAHKTILKYTADISMDKVTKIFAEVDEYSKTKLENIVKPLAGVLELLHNLKQVGILASIATTDLTYRAILSIKAISLEDLFIDIVGADLVKNAKPSADLIDFIANKNRLLHDEIVVIGDSMVDLGMSKSAKCKFIGVKTGLYTSEFLYLSEYLIDDLTNLKVIR